MDSACLSSNEELPPLIGKGAPRPCIVTPLQGSTPHTVFYDLTHDNESPLMKRTAEDALATGALVTFTKAALGSNKGFDDLYPKLLNLVTDNRLYDVNEGKVDGGIGRVKRVLNHLHTEMLEGGFVEGHVHEEGEVRATTRLRLMFSQYIVVHRVHPITHKGYMLVVHTAFKGFFGHGWSESRLKWCSGVLTRVSVKPIRLSRTKVKYIFGATLKTRFSEWQDDPKVHRGIPSTLEEIPEPHIKLGFDGEDYAEIVVPDSFDPGSIMVFATDMAVRPFTLTGG